MVRSFEWLTLGLARIVKIVKSVLRYMPEKVRDIPDLGVHAYPVISDFFCKAFNNRMMSGIYNIVPYFRPNLSLIETYRFNFLLNLYQLQ